jgi:hypothetical protein
MESSAPIEKQLTPVRKCKEALGTSLYKELKSTKGLNIKDILFLAEYVSNGFNAIDAWLNSHGRKNGSRNHAGGMGRALLKTDGMREALRIFLEIWLAERKGKLETKIIDVLMARAFYDIADFINADGSPKFESLEDVPEAKRCVIDGIETRSYGKDADKQHTVLKLADREKAIEKLSAYIKLYRDPTGVVLELTEDTVRNLKRVFGEDEKVEGKEKKVS